MDVRAPETRDATRVKDGSYWQSCSRRQLVKKRKKQRSYQARNRRWNDR